MQGYTLVELLLFISFLEPLETGVMEGMRAGMIGALMGLMVGLLITSLWTALFLSWARRYWDKLGLRRDITGVFLSTVVLMMIALPIVTLIMTHRLAYLR